MPKMMWLEMPAPLRAISTCGDAHYPCCRYDSDDPTWSGIGPRPPKRQAYAAGAGGKAAQNSRSPEERWASLIGTAPSRIAAEQEAQATPEAPPGPASGEEL